jgi:hypothetical protein
MNTILEQYEGKIKGTFSFFDRMIIKGHIRQFFSPSGKKHFLSFNDILLKDFPAYAQSITEELCKHIEEYTKNENRPLIYLPSAIVSKEETARAQLKASPVEEGLICTLSAVENCSTLQPLKNKDTGLLYLANVNRKCKYYYLYFKDKTFGFMHVKLQTWFPFQMQIYINGRELMSRLFDSEGIDYSMHLNSFIHISDVEKAQELADKFNSEKLCRMLDKFAKELNPYLETIVKSFNQGYFWCVDQCEYATDIMFKSREDLEDIYPSLVEHAFFSFKCEDVFSFLGRKLDAKFQGELVSDYRKRPQGYRIKHKMKSNSIKMYDKFSILRIETTINNPREFKTRRQVRHKDGTTSMRWCPMGKSISNLYRYTEVSKASNMRYIKALTNIIPKGAIEKEINSLCGKVCVKSKHYTGFNVWEQDTFRLFCELSNAAYLIRGFTNSDIRRAFWAAELADLKTNRNRMTRLFAKLRAHGLIKKVPRSLRYLVSDKGRRIMSALICLRYRQYPPLVV